MPRINGIKRSKSELIYALLDGRTRAKTLKDVLRSTGVRLPKTVLFGENYDPELCKRCLLEGNHRGFYSYFSIKKTPKVEGDSVVLVRNLMQETNRRLFNLLRSPDFPRIPAALPMKNDAERIFYFSLLIAQNRCPKVEHSLLLLLYGLFENAPGRMPLEHCKIKFSRSIIGEFIQSHICELDRCYKFLSLIAHKLPEDLAELWLENGFDACDRIFSRLNSLRISENARFDRSVFDSLVKFKSFRKAVFNSVLSDEFVISMEEYANRPDFDYFYRVRGIRRRHCLLAIPRNVAEYEFFNAMSEKLAHSNIVKIRNYQIRHGHTHTLNTFISEHLAYLLKFIENENLAEDIVMETIKYNNSRAISTNDVIFDELRKRENVFRRIAGCFEDPKDRTLCDLVARNFNFGITSIVPYINLGYDEEIMEYLEAQSIADTLSIVDSWNREFLARVFARRASSSISDAKLLLDFAISNDDLASVPEVLDHVLNVDSDEIFNNLPERLKVIYLLRHRSYVSDFVDSIDPETCTLDQASQIFEVLEPSGDGAFPTHNFYYGCAVCDTLEFDESNIVNSLFAYCYIRKHESKYVFVEYFNRFVDEVVRSCSKEEIIACVNQICKLDDLFYFRMCGGDRIRQSLSHPFDFDKISRISFVLELWLRSKHSTFILFDRLVSMLSDGSSSHRILVLGFVDPSTLCKTHILRYISVLIPLLDGSNSTVCRLSRDSLNMIKVETREIQNILPDITRSLTNREHFPVFMASLESTVFNNYLCFNSLNILVQLMLKFLDDYTKDALFILGRIASITKDKDMEQISNIVFSSIGRFVVANSFHTKDALEVSGQFCQHAKLPDFDILLRNATSMRICSYLVGILKIRKDPELNAQIIAHVLKDKDSAVDPSFIAAVSELEEFTQYLDRFVPMLKTLFVDDGAEVRNIAGKAFKHILESSSKDHVEEINTFLLDCSINRDYPIRLLILDVLDYLPMVYILRNDHHSLVRKKALDIWKARVFNTNKALKEIYGSVLDLIEFASNKTFCFSLQGTVRDMAIKYAPYLELYVKSNDKKPLINEFILVEALKAGKLQDAALEFCKSWPSVSILRLLCKTPGFMEKAVCSLKTSDLIRACDGDGELALALYSRAKDPSYLGFLSTTQMIGLIRSHSRQPGLVSESDRDMIFVLQIVESCAQVEDLLVKIHPTYSYHYLLIARTDYGSMRRMFERVFENCRDIDNLVSERNIKYIRHCRVDRIQNKTCLLSLFLSHEDKSSFEKVIFLLKECIVCVFDQDLVFEIMGYLLRNYLSVNRRADCYECIMGMYEKYRERMGFFRQIVQTSILNH